jgi:hypothetical protein
MAQRFLRYQVDLSIEKVAQVSGSSAATVWRHMSYSGQLLLVITLKTDSQTTEKLNKPNIVLCCTLLKCMQTQGGLAV